MASSMFIILSVSRIMTTSSIKDKDFVKKNKNYIVVNKSKFDKDDYNNLMNLNTSKIVVLGDSIVNFEVTYNTLMQNYEIYYDQISGSITPLSGLKEEDIITGKMPTNKYELVIDKLVLDKLFTLEGSAVSAGIKDINELIGTKLKINNMKDFKIVRITNNESPNIYANDDVIFDIIYNSQNDIELKYQSINNYEYNLVKGRNPENNYEVLVPDNMKDIYSLNTKLEDKITIRQLKDFIMQSQIYMSCTSALAPSHTMRMLLITTEIEKKKKQLANGKYKEAIANNDIVAVGQMEKELFEMEGIDINTLD